MSAPGGAGQLTPAEVEVLEAITNRIIPSGEFGAGAAEGRVSRYVCNALESDYRTHLNEYRHGLAATESYAQSRFGRAFPQLAPAEQDAILATIERGAAPGAEHAAPAFFALVRQHTIEGMFGDPVWGGNAAYVGWRLIGYEGPKYVWTAADQEIEPLDAGERPLRNSGPGSRRDELQKSGG